METDLTKISIEDLVLTPPTKHCLKAVDIRSVGQLMGYTESQLLTMFAGKSAYSPEIVIEIRKALGGQGLHLRRDGLELKDKEMTDDIKTEETCKEYIQLLSNNANPQQRIVALEKRLIEVEASYKAYQKFTTPLVASSEIIPLPRAETFLEVGKRYVFGLGKIVYKGKIKGINDNEIYITDVSVTILDEDYCGLAGDGMDIKEEIILLKNTLHRIAIAK